LSDQFVKALSIELFTDGANTSFASLSGTKTLVEFFLEIHDIYLASWYSGDVTYPKTAHVSVLSRRQNIVQVIPLAGRSCLI
jgi:hypothetical protein